MRSKWILVAGLVCGVLVGAGVFLFRSYTTVFPELPPGVYTGTIQSRNGEPARPWLVIQYPQEQSLVVSVGDLKIPAQRVAPVDPSGVTRLPLVVGDSSARLRFTGRKFERGDSLRGEYSNPISHDTGRWRLARLRNESVVGKSDHELTTWFSLFEEVEKIDEQIQASQQKADQQRTSIDNLGKYVADGDVLRKTADVRLNRTDSQVESKRNELSVRQAQLDRSLRDFELSQRISREGKLVFLSRETIQRESRWIELSLKLLAPETSVGFEQALERAERIQSLRRTIARERAEPVEQATAERYSGESAETSAEEEFYEQLQQ